MAKLIYTLEGVLVAEYPLNKERISIGRREDNHIHVDDLAVSGEHAVITTIGRDSFLEDLESTNGTLINGKRVKWYALQEGDEIQLGRARLRYAQGDATEKPVENGFAQTIMLPMVEVEHQYAAQPQVNGKAPATSTVPVPSASVAKELDPKPAAGKIAGVSLQLMQGTKPGKELFITKSMTTLGKVGVQVAVITKRNEDYYLAHVEGDEHPKLNGESIGTKARLLKNEDLLELAGVQMRFKQQLT